MRKWMSDLLPVRVRYDGACSLSIVQNLILTLIEKLKGHDSGHAETSQIDVDLRPQDSTIH